MGRFKPPEKTKKIKGPTYLDTDADGRICRERNIATNRAAFRKHVADVSKETSSQDAPEMQPFLGAFKAPRAQFRNHQCAYHLVRDNKHYILALTNSFLTSQCCFSNSSLSFPGIVLYSMFWFICRFTCSDLYQGEFVNRRHCCLLPRVARCVMHECEFWRIN
jgi:hypothetical protein